jgi:hypothetical protein
VKRIELTSPTPGDDRTAALRRLTWLLDDAIRLPLGFRVGLDALIGLVPGLGDVVGGAASLYGLSVAWGLGAPPIVLARMAVNAGLDALVGAIPLLGDLWDVGFASHRRNLALLEGWLATPHRAERQSRWVLIGLALALIGVLVASFALALWAVIWLLERMVGGG